MERACGHCGRSNALESKGNVLIKRIEDQRNEITIDTYVEILYCLACDAPVIFQVSWSDDIGETWGERQLYPAGRDNEAIPEKVRTRLEAAGRVKLIEPGLYAVGVRRMLESVAHEEGATGDDLFSKLDDLVRKDRIPAPLAEAAHEIRKLGNLGAHDDEVEIQAADVPAIEALADAILEYLYRAPATLDAVKGSLDKRRAAAQA